MAREGEWQSKLDRLDADQRFLVEGGNLSRRFSKLSLTTSHPAFISAFYGILLSIVLFFPLGYDAAWEIESWLIGWTLYSLILILMLSLLGGLSLQIIRLTGRMPVSVPRILLFTAPFVGLVLLTLSIGRAEDLPAWLSDFGLLLMVVPGPVYVHLSWAPRWRLLEMLEAGLNPFKATEARPEAARVNDHELMEVVDKVIEEE